VKKGTTEEDVQRFVEASFPKIDFVVEKLDSKGENCSFKLGVDFTHKDVVMDSACWPKNTTLKRFLFLRRQSVKSL